MRNLVAISLVSLLGLTWTAAARAETLCMTVPEFNDYLAAAGGATTTVTLRFDVTGVNPADFFNSKGCLAELDDSRCTVGAGFAAANVKVYGTSDPPNTSHPAGTLKFEYGTECCAAPPCVEGWADPNASAVVFTDGTEQCTVTVTLDPLNYGYSIQCAAGLFEAVGDNNYDLMVTQASILERTDGGWAMPNAVSTWNEICFETPVTEPPGPGVDVTVVEDVTASTEYANAVYEPVADLCSEAGTNHIYLKFDLGAVPGRVEKAELFLHRADTPSADGSGGDVYLVPSNAWSETTLTWSNRPPPAAVPLARVSPVADYAWYGWDVSAAVQDPAVYSFAIVPQAVDTNGAHFFSKEGSAAFAPYMHVEYAVVDGDGDGSPDGPDCDDANGAVHPNATEVCNGVDDDCDGALDEGCSVDAGGGGGDGGAGGDSASGGSGATGGTGPVTSHAADPNDGAGSDERGGCGCRLQGAASVAGWSSLVLVLTGLLGLGCARRRRR